MKVVIGVPAFAGILPEGQQNFMRLVFRLGRDTDYDIVPAIVTKSEQFRARNRIVTTAREANADYLLMLDDDMLVPPDLVQRLIAHDKDVVGALYYQRGGDFHPVVMKMHEDEIGSFSCRFLDRSDPVIMHPGLYPVDIIGGGCMLFKMHVFDKLIEPYFTWEHNIGTDLQICRRMLEAGFQPYIDTTIELGHIGERCVVNSRTIPVGYKVFQDANNELFEDLKRYLNMSDDKLIYEMDKAVIRERHAAEWNAKDRSTWDGIKDFYQSEDPVSQLTTLAHYNIRKPSVIKSWALMPENALIRRGGNYLDYGSGLGHLSVPLAKKAAVVWAIDLKGAPTTEFLKWRTRSSSESRCYSREIEVEIPEGVWAHDLDGSFMLSVIEHLVDPYGVIEWIRQHTKIGGFLAVEWYVVGAGEHEPQHLDHHDTDHFPEWMEKHGWEMSAEHVWLFFRKE